MVLFFQGAAQLHKTMQGSDYTAYKLFHFEYCEEYSVICS